MSYAKLEYIWLDGYKPTQSLRSKTRVEREIKILKTLRHNNIIQLYSVISTSTTIYLIMEYASGKELFDYIVKKNDYQRNLHFFDRSWIHMNIYAENIKNNIDLFSI